VRKILAVDLTQVAQYETPAKPMISVETEIPDFSVHFTPGMPSPKTVVKNPDPVLDTPQVEHRQ
jgi:hypothetical protein